MGWFDPVDWSAWLYGKWGHVPIILVALAVLGGIVAVWLRGVDQYREQNQVDPPRVAGMIEPEPSDDESTANRTQTVQPCQLPVIPVDPNDVMAPYRQMRESLADTAFVANYQGKCLEAEGVISEIDDNYIDGVWVLFGAYDDDDGIFACLVPLAITDTVSHLVPGDRVAVRGTLERALSGSVTLMDCVLIGP